MNVSHWGEGKTSFHTELPSVSSHRRVDVGAPYRMMLENGQSLKTLTFLMASQWGTFHRAICDNALNQNGGRWPRVNVSLTPSPFPSPKRPSVSSQYLEDDVKTSTEKNSLQPGKANYTSRTRAQSSTNPTTNGCLRAAISSTVLLIPAIKAGAWSPSDQQPHSRARWFALRNSLRSG